MLLNTNFHLTFLFLIRIFIVYSLLCSNFNSEAHVRRSVGLSVYIIPLLTSSVYIICCQLHFPDFDFYYINYKNISFSLPPRHSNGVVFIITGAGCKVAGFLTVFASHLSVFTLTVITIERWLAITHALYLNHRIKLRPAAYIMMGGWIYSIVMSAMPLFGISNYSSTR